MQPRGDRDSPNGSQLTVPHDLEQNDYPESADSGQLAPPRRDEIVRYRTGILTSNTSSGVCR